MNFICTTCGTRYPDSEYPPDECPICQDERQYVNPMGQQWTSDTTMQGHFANQFIPLTPTITAIRTSPTFAIGQRAHLLHTNDGIILWDCITYIDDATINEIKKIGGITAIAISHPHFFSGMGVWSHAFGDVPIYLHETLRPYVMNPISAIHFWKGEQQEIVPGVTVIRCGGHFLGSTVLHWREANALFTGDTISIVPDSRYVSFMYSYPNDIPLDEESVRHIVNAIAPFPFTTLYDAWKQLDGDALSAITASADRYIDHLRGVPQR
jgi:hypothetical protein